ncbi:unnamed protein product [Ambrosiozyma monospora]|uniref:Unnamed protein product n=1 Tax=Ambrosiozyma monospora TaxID=43982 RepID=A0ACB5TB04_AMBMO|nr:unnamed protein product [Ambrosiozyma monospora]
MNALLYVPGFCVVLYFLNDENLLLCVLNAAVFVFVQVGMNWQFLEAGDEIRSNFINGAFNFGRQFMYKWTVNWKFLSEEVFLDSKFHTFLLVLQVVLLLSVLLLKWVSVKATGKPISQLIKDGLKFWSCTISPKHIIFDQRFGGRYVMLVICGSNMIGILCARSLHYQFLSWYYYSLPFLLSACSFPLIVDVALVVAHEWCWNVYPSTALSSGVLVSILSLIVVRLTFVDWFKVIEPESDEKSFETKKNN